MFSKFKSAGLKSLNNFVRHLSTPESSILGNKTKYTLLQAATIHNDYHYKDRKRYNSKIFNQTNYLLISAFSVAYLDRKYDLFRNYISQFSVQAKVAHQDQVPNLETKSSKKPEINIRKTYNFLADAAEEALSSVVQIEVYEEDPYFGGLIKVSSGSGFIASKSDSKSFILTNSHVVLDHRRVVVLLQNGKKLTGTVEYIDNFTDLASVKIDDVSSPILKLDSSKDIRVGEFVVAIGSPLGLGNSVTAGIISSTARKGSEIGLNNDEMEYIQTDAFINLGNSGGPLIALNGKCIGINTFKVLPGINLAIPSDYAIKFLENSQTTSNDKKLDEKRINRKRFFGTQMLSLTPNILEELKKRIRMDGITHGVLLVKVEHDSIAEKAGLRTGDVIIEINHKQTSEASEIYKTIEENSQLSLLVIRDGQKIRFNVSFN